MPAMRRAQPGRTFMELMVVLVVLGLLAGIVLPRYAAAHSRGAVKAGTRDLVTTLGYAHGQAAVEGRSYRVVVDQTAGQLSVEYFAPEQGEDAEEPYVPDVGILGGTQTLPTGVSFAQVAVGEEAGGVQTPQGAPSTDTSERTYVRFWPDGTADQAFIVIANEDGNELSIAVDQFTARARILEPEEAEELRSELGLD